MLFEANQCHQAPAGTEHVITRKQIVVLQKGALLDSCWDSKRASTLETEAAQAVQTALCRGAQRTDLDGMTH